MQILLLEKLDPKFLKALKKLVDNLRQQHYSGDAFRILSKININLLPVVYFRSHLENVQGKIQFHVN